MSYTQPIEILGRGRITVTLRGQPLEVNVGTHVEDLFAAHLPHSPWPPLGAIVNQRLVELGTPLRTATEVIPITYGSRDGASIYRRSLILVLYEAAREILGEARLVVGQSFDESYYFDLDSGKPVDGELLAALERQMRAIVAEDRPFHQEVVPAEEAAVFFGAQGFGDKASLLRCWRDSLVRLVTCGRFQDIRHGAFAPSTALVNDFALELYPPGFVLRFPSHEHPGVYPPLPRRPKLFEIYRETRQWNETLGVENIGALNQLAISGGISEIIKVAEGFHEKKIARIADEIAARRRSLRLILIAGPSASGKTTFSKRLAIQLLVNGIRPVNLSLDNFYVDREATPRDADGNLDFEALESIDLPLLNQTLGALLAGQRVATPEYDFVRGKRKPKNDWVPLRLGQNEILVVEGIHGLNDRLTSAVPAEAKYRVYVSALTQLCIDDHNRIFTSDTRLIRRMIRDRLFRGYSAAVTLERWPSVRRGEYRHIFPYQEEADVMFNSALVYEPAVVKIYAERFLLEVPATHPTRPEAWRLLKFLEMFVPVFRQEVPHTSILREFIGDSSFHY